MNLFVEELAGYIRTEWDRALTATDGPREARFIVQSLDPSAAFGLFEALDGHRAHWLQVHQIECHLRVATGLWTEWCRDFGVASLDGQMAACGGLGPDGGRPWIDEEDRLTWYRNRTRVPGSDGLVVVLVGLDHATDQGGLSDFHRVDEARLWRAMGGGFAPWVRRLAGRLGLDASEAEIERFDAVIQQLFQVRPLRLARLADFLEHRVIAGRSVDSLNEVFDTFCAALPFWGIPPVLPEGQAVLKGKKGATMVKEADTFISHQRYKTPAGRKKDWQKIDAWLDSPDFDLPQTIDDEPAYDDVDAYRDTLRAFIDNADAEARDRLLRTDALPLLRVLKQRVVEPGDDKPKKEKEKTLSGWSFEVLLQAVWLILERLQKAAHGRPLWDVLAGVHIELTRFDHDLATDGDDGAAGLARDLLRGCLGGLEAVFEGIYWRLPLDEDQALLPRDRWERTVPLKLELGFDNLTLGRNKGQPKVQFRVLVRSQDGQLDQIGVFKWVFGQTQPERVRLECAKAVRNQWQPGQHPAGLLPAFRIHSDVMTALYFAADAQEANRLVGLALSGLDLLDLMQGLDPNRLAPELERLVKELVAAYLAWLDCAIKAGYYQAQTQRWVPLLDAYQAVARAVLDENRLGSDELLRRFYKAFLVVDETAQPNAATLPAALAWGLSPAVLELTQAQVWYLQNGFPDAAAELALGRDGKIAFRRLFALAELQRPLAILVDAHRHLSAEIKSFGLLHYLGAEPNAGKSLAVQTLLREDEAGDDEKVSDILAVSDPRKEERAVVVRVLREYLGLYPFAEDGLRILAVNVKELGTILAGVDDFLKGYLSQSPADWPPFHCAVTVYSTGASPLAMEARLALWRDAAMERHREAGRGLILSVGHRYAPKDKVTELLKQERRLYDFAFLFHFLQGELTGEADPALPFEYRFHGWSGGQFPIGDYPRPIQAGDPQRRQSLLSTRRLRIQTRHADLSARLCNPGYASNDHVIFGRVNYAPWTGIVDELHRKAQWVACIDPFVDKRLIGAADGEKQRKIVGFTSGLGAYGELNLTISTEQDTLAQLSRLVADRLTGLLPFADPDGFAAMAVRVVNEAEEVIGLASLRAVVGDGERVREVIGFAAIRRALTEPSAEMSQLLPLDSLLHWFADSETALRPDLLQLSLQLREGNIPLVRAVLVECKLAKQNPGYLVKATEQIQDGLSHLTQLLAPRRSDLRRPGFDRRYWWAQLHRALTSRSVVNLPQQRWRALDRALEALAEGDYEIQWQAAICTFWTDQAGPQPTMTALPLPAGTVEPPFTVPAGFGIVHMALGYQGLAALFAETRPAPLLTLGEPAIRVRPEGDSPAAAVPPQATPETVASTPQSPSTGGTDTTSASQPSPVAPPSQTKPDPNLPPWPTETKSTPPRHGPGSTPAQPPAVQFATSGSPATSLSLALPERLLIGTRNSEPVYWHFGHPQLPNRHLLIFGASGSGKTYGIQCLLAEMAQQGLRSLIIDYTDGFLPQQMERRFAEAASPKSHYVVTERLPLNPFRRQQQVIDPSLPPLEEKPYQVATRIESIFASIFELGDQQSAALIRAIESGIEAQPGFALSDVLQRLRDDSPYGETLANKLEPLIRAEPFRGGDGSAWEDMLTSQRHRVQILQLKGLAREIQKMVTEFALWDLYDYACNTGTRHRPIPVVLDEIQNLDHSSDSPIDKMLREGRKFGLALMLATQTTSQFNQEQRDRLFQAGHKLFFKPATTEVDRFAQLLSQSTGDPKNDWAERLSRLEKGQCYSLGPVMTSSGALKERALLVSVTALEQRTFGASVG